MSTIVSHTTTPQGDGSATWTPFPFDTEYTFPGLYAINAEKSPNHPAFVYDDEGGNVQTVYHKDLYSAVIKAGSIVSKHIGASGLDVQAPQAAVGILAVADSISYNTLTVGIIRAGYVAFPLSARNSASAIIHLIRSTDVRFLYVSADGAMQRLAEEARDALLKEGHELALLPFPRFGDLYGTEEPASEEELPGLSSLDPHSTAMILHSSGSTSFPKPIRITHIHLQQRTQVHWYNDMDVCGLRIAMHGLPMFHVMGILGTTMMLGRGAVLAVFRPSTPPIIATPETHMAAAIATKAESIFCVPSFIEAWARDPDALPRLRALKYLQFAGAPLNKEIGDSLFRQGVKLQTAFGMTEVGAIGWGNRALARAAEAGWEWFTIPELVDAARLYENDTPGVFELVVFDSPTWHTSVVNTELDGRKAYATSDLFMEHPRDPRLVRVYGRADDQIILSTGEKTNPIPMEAILIQDPAIEAALIFGRGRFQNGVLVQPKEPFDPADEGKLVRFRDLVWPAVERANEHAPSHSRIFKEMIIVTHPAKPFQLTAKGTPRRHISIKDYEAEIEALYHTVEEASQVNVPPPAEWSEDATRSFVRSVVSSVMHAPTFADEDDLFQQGCDSLQATYIRNALIHALRSTATKASHHAIPTNLVYDHPSIDGLATFLLGLLAGNAFDADAECMSHLDKMQKMLQKYSAEFPAPRWTLSNKSIEGETVLITGSTGRLGSHLLSQMLQRADVRRIYALNRGTSGRERQLEAFAAWGLDKSLLEDTGRVVFCASELANESLGLGNSLYEELCSSVTIIIHNAWRVDFNVSLPSFEPLISGARNLIDLALTSDVPGGPKMIFVSSISSLNNYSSSVPAEETLTHGPEMAVSRGYGESKWVTEQILGRAASTSGLRATVVRVGQLCGDTRQGGWNTKEWVPAIARVSQKIGCAPETDDTIAWVPVDVAAATLLDVLHAATFEPVMHLVAPNPVTWRTVFKPLADRLGVSLVPAQEWLRKAQSAAERAATSGEHESAFQLMAFFESALGAKGTTAALATDRAVSVSKSLATMHALGEEDVATWLRYWGSVGFLKL